MGQQISISDEAFKAAKAEADRKGIKVSEAVSQLVVTGELRRAAVRRNAEKNRTAKKPAKAAKAAKVAKAPTPAKAAKPAKAVSKAPQKEAPAKAAGRAKGPGKKTTKPVKKSSKDSEPAGVEFLDPTPVAVDRPEDDDVIWDD